MAKSLAERLWSKVDKTDGCWNWTGATSDGYGRIGIGKKSALAHRVAFELVVGPVPDGKVLDHLCFNRACIRPDHLRITDTAGNGQNRAGAPRNSSTGVRGVTRSRWGYQAQVKTAGRNHYLGTFTTLEAAEVAVVNAREQLFALPGGSR